MRTFVWALRRRKCIVAACQVLELGLLVFYCFDKGALMSWICGSIIYRSLYERLQGNPADYAFWKTLLEQEYKIYKSHRYFNTAIYFHFESQASVLPLIVIA